MGWYRFSHPDSAALARRTTTSGGALARPASAPGLPWQTPGERGPWQHDGKHGVTAPRGTGDVSVPGTPDPNPPQYLRAGCSGPSRRWAIEQFCGGRQRQEQRQRLAGEGHKSVMAVERDRVLVLGIDDQAEICLLGAQCPGGGVH